MGSLRCGGREDMRCSALLLLLLLVALAALTSSAAADSQLDTADTDVDNSIRSKSDNLIRDTRDAGESQEDKKLRNRKDRKKAKKLLRRKQKDQNKKLKRRETRLEQEKKINVMERTVTVVLVRNLPFSPPLAVQNKSTPIASRLSLMQWNLRKLKSRISSNKRVDCKITIKLQPTNWERKESSKTPQSIYCWHSAVT